MGTTEASDHIPSEMKTVWSHALALFTHPILRGDKRTQETQFVEALKQNLEFVGSIPELNATYRSDRSWALHTARETYYRGSAGSGLGRPMDAAFGLRYVELMTNIEISATKPPPEWIGEWAVW